MSETSNQLNPQQNSGLQHPNSTKVEKTEPVSPGQTATTQTTNPAQATGPSSNIAFHSAAIGTQTARPKDYFAEQNQETLTKKQAHSTRIRWLLIFSCGLVGVALAVGLIWWIIASINKNVPAVDEKPYEEMSESEQTERNVNIGQEVYEASKKEAKNTGESNESYNASAA